MVCPDHSLANLAADVAGEIDRFFPRKEAAVRSVMHLASEVGEFAGAYLRANGMARRSGSVEDMRAELADVVITAYVTAHYCDIDLDDVIASKSAQLYVRGFRDSA